MSDPDAFDKFCDRWMDKIVEFTLLGRRVRGTVYQVEVWDPYIITAEFYDGPHRVRVEAYWQAFKRV